MLPKKPLLIAAALLASPSVHAKQPAEAERLAREVVALQREAQRQNLSEQPMWWRLVHYEESWLGVESQADGGLFFNATDGKHHPAAELQATIAALFGPAPADKKVDHPYCRFPARLAWLHSKLDFDFSVLPQQHCERWDEFRTTTNAESLSLIFSSYYLNNPSSATGHTLLRLNKRRKSTHDERQALLDYGVNFGATVDTGNAILYAFKGLLGLFPGEMSRVPYYFKVREYNDYESRDLWEFELNLNPREVQMAVAHIWELGWTYFDYFYLTENCSFQMLKILEVARGDLDLVSHLGWPVLPADTLMAVATSPDLISKVVYRASARRQFHHRLEVLRPQDVAVLQTLASDPEAKFPASISTDQQVKIFDAALDLMDFRHSEGLLDPESPESAHKQTLMRRRAQLGIQSADLHVPARAEENPLTSHGVRRLDIGVGRSSSKGHFQALDFRLALHDLGDPGLGYPDTLSIAFLPIRLRYYHEQQHLELDQLHLVSITSLVPLDTFIQSISWNVRVGVERLVDSACDRCLAGVVETGGGVTIASTNRAAMAYAMLNARVAGFGPFEGGLNDWPFRIGPVGDVGLRFRLSARAVLLLQADILLLPFQAPTASHHVSGIMRWMYAPDFAVAVETHQTAVEWSAQVSSSLYF